MQKILLIPFLIATFFSNAVAGQVLDKKLGFSDRNITGLVLINTVKEQSGAEVTYDEAVDKVLTRQIAVRNMTPSVREALNWLKADMRVTYKNKDNYIILTLLPPVQKPGKISGKIVDDKGEPLPGASIKIVELNKRIQSNVDGSYQVSVPSGNYTLEVSYMSFQTKRIADVLVKEDLLTKLDIVLNPATNALSEVVVRSSYRKESINGLYARQKNNAALSDGITAEQISRSPDNNTAQVLRRVSGLQISQNKYVVIRGLSDRYNNLLLNGAPMPSSEPNRRDFAFDMVPSALVDNIVVNKTATPDLTGEFTGGLVQITTKDIPEENFTQFSVGSGYNTRATGKDFTSLGRSKNAYLGFADGKYDKPKGMTFQQYNQIVSQVEDRQNVDQRKQAAAFLGTLPDNWAMRKYTAMPMQNYQLSLGRAIPIKENQLGIIAALTYRNEQEADQNDRYETYTLDYKGTDYTFSTTLGGSLNLAYRFGKNKITLKNTYNRKFSDLLYQFEGHDINNSSIVSNYSNVTVINQLFQSVLSGEHTLGKRGIKLDWQGSLADLSRDQPYTKIMDRRRGDIGSFEPEYYSYSFSDRQASLGSLYYSDLKEKSYSWATNAQLPFKLLGLMQSFKAGYQGKYRTADFGADIYRIRSLAPATSSPIDYSGYAYYDVYNPVNFASGDLYLYPISGSGKDVSTSGSGQGYKGFQRLNAFYGMFDLKFTKQLRLIAGMRAERNDQNISGLNPTNGKEELVSLKKTDWLPSANLIYSLTDQMNVRLAAYKTVARPDLRELSSFEYFDPIIMRNISGNNLKSTTVENLDLRYEFYPAPGEIISVSGFYKKFKDPIELQLFQTSGRPEYRYVNLEGARDIGIELDLRKSLNFIMPESGLLKNIYVSGSLTWLKATVDLAPTQDSTGVYKRDRPLYGQSPYIINGGISYTGKHFGINALYNRYGKRIVYAATAQSYDEYERPCDIVDLQFSYKFLKQQRAEVKFNISDLLNQQLLIYQNRYAPGHPVYKEGDPSVQDAPGVGYKLADGQPDPEGLNYNAGYDVVTARRRNGTNFSLSFSYKF
ncbi:TonB-dependent receptor [Pedobacter hiemivivus]|uniref:TonB-dependent receptor n=1 Tax=Pedobacter hiemivivus TaxID=2530454 RepID=A0A4R0N8X6_9SPHI|nr:TonB-dependent receptor [Pedobacter hiemivivus]TCC96570.1 TonB-dependent receptor [Pedobacter hiemivivus]